MKIILVANSDSTRATLDLRYRRTFAKVAGIIALGIVLCMGLGVITTKLLANSRSAAVEKITALRDTIAHQQQALRQFEIDSRRDLDALALQLGSLQAQATRLNALGQRLTEVGKLGDGEFDFAKAPALGGAEDPNAAPHALNFDLAGNISNLRSQFAEQEIELGVLEQFLLDRKLQTTLVPAGYPVANSYIGSGFGERVDPINGEAESHLGLDFDAEAGSEIKAVAGGVVIWSGERSGYGRVVEIDHGNGYMTRYAHNQQNIVRVGDKVEFGQVIAKVGSTGRATGPHCHFEVWLNDKAVNPNKYVNGSMIKRL